MTNCHTECIRGIGF
ncbi:hypothetical protein D047_0055A, partial [Vibrio parahaemolyticus VPTS-2010_2]